MVETCFSVSVDVFPDGSAAVIGEEKMVPLPSFCQLNLIGRSDEATQVKLAFDPDLTVVSFGSWVMVGGSDERIKYSNQLTNQVHCEFMNKISYASQLVFCMQQ